MHEVVQGFKQTGHHGMESTNGDDSRKERLVTAALLTIASYVVSSNPVLLHQFESRVISAMP